MTAEEWERYNTTMRNILKQWPVDFSTYRFATTDYGLEVAFTVPDDAKAPVELIFIQTILQAFAVLPDVPTITVVMGDWEVKELSRTTVNEVSRLVAGQSVEELFVISSQNPVGKRTLKFDDFIYSRYGDYNPYPTLALLTATTPTQQFYATARYTVLYPKTLSVRSPDERETLFYTGETNFLSPTAWSEFGLTIKVYDAPNITLEQWLSVNRLDQLTELTDLTSRQPTLSRHVITGTTYADEYVLLADNYVYVLTIQRDDGLTEADRMLLKSLVESFSLFYALQRY